MLVVFHSGEDMILTLEFLNETQHWSGLVERHNHFEHVQAIRVYVGSGRLKLLFLQESWKFWR